jgi:glucosylceramidase
MPAGASDSSQDHFSIAHDEEQILPLLREAKQLNPTLQIAAATWSPPAWMKTSQSLIGGRLIDDPKIYRSYALYLTKFIEAYRAQGVTINAITVQNEPQNRNPAGYPGTDMPAAQEEQVIEALGPMLPIGNRVATHGTDSGMVRRVSRVRVPERAFRWASQRVN